MWLKKSMNDAYNPVHWKRFTSLKCVTTLSCWNPFNLIRHILNYLINVVDKGCFPRLFSMFVRGTCPSSSYPYNLKLFSMFGSIKYTLTMARHEFYAVVDSSVQSRSCIVWHYLSLVFKMFGYQSVKGIKVKWYFDRPLFYYFYLWKLITSIVHANRSLNIYPTLICSNNPVFFVLFGTLQQCAQTELGGNPIRDLTVRNQVSNHCVKSARSRL